MVKFPGKPQKTLMKPMLSDALGVKSIVHQFKSQLYAAAV